jgi:hypothetical protein
VASSATPSAQALVAVNPCDPASADVVCAFQRSVGQTPDGKYGSDTAHALVAQVPSAPGACHPRPPWWAPKGQGNCGGAVASGGGPGGGGDGGGLIVPPHEDKKEGGISTGALIAGGIGAAALVGIVAIAAGAGKKPITRYRTRKAPKKGKRK